MPNNVYSEINLHLTWHTKLNAASIDATIESRLYHYLEHRILKARGVQFHAIGGTEDHVHLAVSVPPTLLISDWVGDLKGASAYYINHEVVNRKLLVWQAGYGVVCFGTEQLNWVIRYIRNQKLHHARGTTHARLERITSDENESP
jgi:putative transposase